MEAIHDLFDIVPVWLIGATLVGAAGYWYLTRHYDYFKKLGIPYVTPIPIFGSVIDVLFKPMHVMELERYKGRGRIFGCYEGANPVLVVAEPELLRDILVKDFQDFNRRRNMKTGNPIGDRMLQVVTGEDWKRIRTIITPAFTTGKIKRMTSIFIDSSNTVAEHFKMTAKLGKSIDCKRYFAAFSMDVIASSAFGTKIDSHNDPNNVFVMTARQISARRVPWKIAIILLFPSIMKLFKIPIFPQGSMDFFKDFILQIMKERREKNQTRNDFLQILMESVKEESEERFKNQSTEIEGEEEDNVKSVGQGEINQKIVKPAYIRKSLSEDELVAQCVVFFFAGFDTTSSTLSFAAYELALNPTIQEKLISEIDQSIREKGDPTYEAICELKYLDAVLSETLRKYPPSYRTERICDSDYLLKGTDLTIPKDMLIQIPIYAIHHDSDHYPDPEKYDPERFIGEQKTSRHPYIYLPFGAGPRNCVGMRFALMEIKVCLVNLLKQFRFRKSPDTKIPLHFYTGQGQVHPKEVTLKVEIRKDAVNI